jgi:hypothetical protein
MEVRIDALQVIDDVFLIRRGATTATLTRVIRRR